MLQLSGLENDTPKHENPNVNQNGNGNIAMQSGFRRDDLLIETNTNGNKITAANQGNNNCNTCVQLSPTSNRSYLKINGYKSIEQMRNNFNLSIDNI